MGGLELPMLAACVVLFVPGYLVLRAVGVPRAWSLTAAPVISVALYSFVTIAYEKVGVRCSPLSVFAVPCVALLLAAVAAEMARRRAGVGPRIELPELSLGWHVLYVLVGLVLCRFIFVSMLPGADALAVGRDLPHHINQVRVFLTSGNWSAAGTDIFVTPEEIAVDPLSPNSSNFYPSTWHVVCALVSACTGAKVATAINAVNAVFTVVCFPLAVLSVLAFVFEADALILFAGSIICLSSMAFPWRFLGWGPLFPNVAAFATMLSGAWMLMRFTCDDVERDERVRLGALFVLTCLGLAFLHPNSAIALCVFVAPYLCMRILHARHGWHVLGRAIPAPVVVAAFLAFAAALWVVLYNASFMQATVTFNWDYNLSEAQGIINVLTLAYLNLVDFDPGQPALAAMVIAGLVWMARHRRYGWLAITYVIGFIPLFVSYSVVPLRHLVSGFWYTDPRRLAALAAIFAIPVATLGFSAVMRLVAKAFKLTLGPLDGASGGRMPRGGWAVPAALVCAFMVVNLFPGFYLPGVIEDVEDDEEELLKVHTAIEVERETIKRCNSDFGEYSRRERAFMDEVVELIGPDALVVNQPFDGSVVAYGDSGVRTYYRYLNGFGLPGETDESVLVRTRLADIATDPEVRDVAHRLGLEYVVQLGPIKEDTSAFRWNYVADEWAGVDAIDSRTPGFELVLRRGRNSLYRIVE